MSLFPFFSVNKWHESRHFLSADPTTTQSSLTLTQAEQAEPTSRLIHKKKTHTHSTRLNYPTQAEFRVKNNKKKPIKVERHAHCASSSLCRCVSTAAASRSRGGGRWRRRRAAQQAAEATLPTTALSKCQTAISTGRPTLGGSTVTAANNNVLRKPFWKCHCSSLLSISRFTFPPIISLWICHQKLHSYFIILHLNLF